MDRYPKTFDNGAGERLTFSARIQEADGVRLVGDNLVAPGAGPPMHVHHFQEEGFTVVAGRLGYQILGYEPKFAGEGESVVFRAGEAHRFWNAGEDDLRCTAYIKPAGNVEFFLEAIFASQKRSGGHRPSIWDAAYLTRRYRTEFSMVEIPALVQRLVFPLIVGLGAVLGKYDRYADAPEPLER